MPHNGQDPRCQQMFGSVQCVLPEGHQQAHQTQWQAMHPDDTRLLDLAIAHAEDTIVKLKRDIGDYQLENAELRDELIKTREQREDYWAQLTQLSPYPPFCHGNPKYIDCIKAGYCRRDPSCSE